MTKLSIMFSVLLMSAAIPATADKPIKDNLGAKGSISSGELTSTPEMWFYEQYQQQYDDPKTAVRQKSEFRAVQRQQRLAAMRWFGFSNTRPHCAVDPVGGDWSPGWKSNNMFYPSQWSGIGRPWVVVRPDRPGM